MRGTGKRRDREAGGPGAGDRGSDRKGPFRQDPTLLVPLDTARAGGASSRRRLKESRWRLKERRIGPESALTGPVAEIRIRGSFFAEGYPSGQREQTVNLPAYAFVGSNPTPSTMRGQTRDRQIRWSGLSTSVSSS